MSSDLEVDVRVVPIDKLVTFARSALVSRQERLEVLVKNYDELVVSLGEKLSEAQRTSQFVNSELDTVKLAIELSDGDKVRVVCPTCNGSGMKPEDVLSGRIFKNQGSAFEGGSAVRSAPLITKHNMCPDCQGKRWQIMPRFKG